MFAGYGGASSAAASVTAPAVASKAAAAGNDGGGGRQQVDEAKGRQEEEETRDDGTVGATGGEFELQVRSDELQSTWVRYESSLVDSSFSLCLLTLNTA
ncbi:hypothetical protein ABVT39_003801 [Epinephelus coioides]